MKIAVHKCIWLLLPCFSLAQNQSVDSISQSVKEVVITGQFEPQSVKKSVHNVRVITKEDIKLLAANNLGDVLNQYLNISIKTSGNDGKSSVSIFGLDSQYFKILVDNIPLVSDTGFGTNIDLTQVNLDDIEQIEIIEGSMGVTHGANAVSGILNIITKKKSTHKWEISLTAQEETVSDEFALFDKGRHIQSAKISRNLGKNLFVSVGGNRNDFAGFFDSQKGKDHLINDGKRGYSWLPKEQLAANAFIGYTKENYKVFYKFDYFNENVDYFNPVVQIMDNYPFPDTHFSSDKRYISNRYFHHLNSYGQFLDKINYNFSASFQKQSRDIEQFNYNLESQSESLNDRQNYQSKEVLYSIATFSNFFKDKKYDLQLGYELVNEKGFFDATAGRFKDEEQQAIDINETFANYDLFAVSEIKLSEKFAVRPGVRYSIQSKFDNQYAASLGLRYLFPKDIEARFSLGKSYRVPNFDEMYTFFVDSNHDMRGNEDLIPEGSTSYELHLKKSTFYDSGLKLSHNLSTTFMNVNDRISLVLNQVTPSLSYRYLNIDSYKMWNLATSHQLQYNNLSAKVGMSLVGISQQINLPALDASSDDKFLYAFQLNSNFSYHVPKWNTVFSLYYKLNGKDQQYVSSTDSNGNTVFVLSQLESYSWMDGSIKKLFLDDQLEVTIGARNLFDIQSIRMTNGSTTEIHSSGSDILLGYGRSYFLKLTYNFNFN